MLLSRHRNEWQIQIMRKMELRMIKESITRISEDGSGDVIPFKWRFRRERMEVQVYLAEWRSNFKTMIDTRRNVAGRREQDVLQFMKGKQKIKKEIL